MNTSTPKARKGTSPQQKNAFGLTRARSASAKAGITVINESFLIADGDGARTVGRSRPHFVDLARETRSGRREIDQRAALIRNAFAFEWEKLAPPDSSTYPNERRRAA